MNWIKIYNEIKENCNDDLKVKLNYLLDSLDFNNELKYYEYSFKSGAYQAYKTLINNRCNYDDRTTDKQFLKNVYDFYKYNKSI